MTPGDILAAFGLAVSALAAWRSYRASQRANAADERAARLEREAEQERRDREIRATNTANKLRSDDAAWTRLKASLDATDDTLTRTTAELKRLREENAELRRMLTARDEQIEHLQAELEGLQAQLLVIHADMPEHREPGDRTRADD